MTDKQSKLETYGPLLRQADDKVNEVQTTYEKDLAAAAGARAQLIRQAHAEGLSQRDIAGLLGKSHQLVNQIITGKS